MNKINGPVRWVVRPSDFAELGEHKWERCIGDAEGNPINDAKVLDILNAHPKYEALAEEAERVRDSGSKAEFVILVCKLAALKAAGEET